MNKDALTVTLSQEDLFVALRYLGFPQMMGLDMQVLQQATEEQVKLALSVAERGLIARTFLQPKEDGSLGLAPVIMAIVIACAQPERSLIVSNQPANKPADLILFHWHRQMRVVHTVPISGIHQFVVLKDDAEMRKAVEQFLSSIYLTTSSNEATFHPVTLTDEIIKGVRVLVEEGESAKAESNLIDHGTSKEFASPFVEALSNLQLVQINSYLNHQEMSQSQGVTLLQGDKTAWLLKPDLRGDTSRVSVEMAISASYQSYILNWL